jgi:hypothetical protein
LLGGGGVAEGFGLGGVDLGAEAANTCLSLGLSVLI